MCLCVRAARVCVCVWGGVRECVRACVRVCVRVVSTDKILHFVNTLNIIITCKQFCR